MLRVSRPRKCIIVIKIKLKQYYIDKSRFRYLRVRLSIEKNDNNNLCRYIDRCVRYHDDVTAHTC